MINEGTESDESVSEAWKKIICWMANRHCRW